MDSCRLLVIGASGSGTTTLGRALASRWSVPHADADDYFWVPTATPYTVKREAAERLPLMEQVFLGRRAWVVSGSVLGWGESLVERFDAVVFVSVDNATRLARLAAREEVRYDVSTRASGEYEAAFSEFMEWAASYEDPTFDGRSRTQHEDWLAILTCPVLRLDSAGGVDELLDQVLAWQEPEFRPES